MDYDRLTKKTLKLKNGDVLPAGCAVSWKDGKATVHVSANRRVRVSALGAARALGIEIPSEEEIGYWVIDSVCDSILGYTVEPDGIDEEGSPSWLHAMGLV